MNRLGPVREPIQIMKKLRQERMELRSCGGEDRVARRRQKLSIPCPDGILLNGFLAYMMAANKN